MTCRLCSGDHPLQRSHVIPEFMYKPIYNPLHQIYMFQEGRRVKILQSGVRERLLCRGCEQRFSRYETYAAPALLQTAIRPFR